MNINEFKRIIKQFFNFIIISGTGWVIDFSIYYILSNKLNLYVGLSNIISAIPSITFVFFVSTKKIFKNNNSRLNLKNKYIIYFLYQIILITIVSAIGQFMYNYLANNDMLNNTFIIENLKMIVKICITPITMVINFIVMKLLSEKI